jgi:DnaK suppressor protein
MEYATIKKTLQNKLDELLKRAHDIEDQLSAPGNADWEENATESENDEVYAKIGDVTKHEIAQIESALLMIDQGTYGKCKQCGKSIPKARLEALPFALTCVNCA